MNRAYVFVAVSFVGAMLLTLTHQNNAVLGWMIGFVSACAAIWSVVSERKDA